MADVAFKPSGLWLASAVVSIASSSIFYTWIWYTPHQFVRAVAPADACTRMAFYANIIKVLQFTSVLACTDFTAAAALSPFAWLCALLLIAAGQHLNALVYKHLGIDGVYYGARFGKKIPWVHAYPYSVMRDPQYIGCILTLLGCAFVLPSELVLWWLANYLYLMWLESKVPESIAGAMM